MTSTVLPVTEIGISYICCRTTYYVLVPHSPEPFDPEIIGMTGDIAHHAEHPECEGYVLAHGGDTLAAETPSVQCG